MIRKARNGAPAILVALLGSTNAACALSAHSHDRILGITCVVSDQAGHPVGGAEVVLKLDPAAYHTVDPVREEQQVSSEAGGVVFMFITHAVSTRYVLTAAKRGYAASEARGVALSGRDGTHVRVTLAPATADAERR